MEEITLIVAGIAFLFLLLCFTIVFLLYATGLLTTVEVGAGAPPINEAIVAYKFKKGPYKYAGELFCEVVRNAPKSKCIGIYYDDPKKVAKEKLRYAVGAILSENGVKVEKEVQDQLEAEGFKFIHLPAVTTCVKASFPYLNTLSIVFAVWKVYPALSYYIEEHKLCAYPMVEVYESEYIRFMAPLSKQEDFFVEEAKESIPEEYGVSKDSSLLDTTEGGTPSVYDDSPSSSCSRSFSSFSYSSRRLMDTFTDDESDAESEPPCPDVQDDEITSSVDVRKSKACTNLLDDSVEKSADVSDVEDMDASQTEAVVPPAEENTSLQEGASLQDSGICSGRTSAAPTEVNTSTDVGVEADVDGNDSSSSFEEIRMDESLNIPLTQ